MSNKDINITNGTGKENILTGDYNVSCEVSGYDNSTINPPTVSVKAGVTVYNFTVGATGTLTLHITEDGTSSGTPIVGASIIRTDSDGNEYASAITTNDQGNAVFQNVPYTADGIEIFYKQTSSDGNHEFDATVKSYTMVTASATIEIQNAVPAEVTFNLTDANYENLPIQSGTLTLSN